MLHRWVFFFVDWLRTDLRMQGKIPLVVRVESADIIATLILLKKEVEADKGSTIRLAISGAQEAHLLATELGEASVGVLLQARPYPASWEKRRHAPSSLLSRHRPIPTCSDPAYAPTLSFFLSTSFQKEDGIPRERW